MALKVILVVLLMLIIYYVINSSLRFYREKMVAEKFSPLKMVVIVKNQEDGIEFFIRRIMAEVQRRIMCIEIILIDTGSKDDTLRILRRLSRMFGFKLYEINESEDDYLRELNKNMGGEGTEGKTGLSCHPVFYYDVRGMSGLELARVPLLEQLLTPAKR